ncbi:MAG: hypothetical protein K6E75_01295 [Lachnospiraceae bacterium]|nr:hypothetical protein [Lachnospiraceae bacterium]
MQKRDARAEPLGKTAKAAKSIRWMVCAADSLFAVLRSAEGETLAGGSEGAAPTGKFSASGKAEEAFPMERCIVACHNAKLALLPVPSLECRYCLQKPTGFL